MKKIWSFINIITVLFLSNILLSEICHARLQFTGMISPGFQGSMMNWIDQNGMFLKSNNSQFMFGFITTQNDSTLYLLVIVHGDSTQVVWTANRDNPVSSSDDFVFDKSGNAFLQKGNDVVWSTDTKGIGVSSMELKDTGNLVLLGDDSSTIIWQSFSHPTDTLLPMQEFKEGMRLTSEPDENNLTNILEIKSGDLILSAGFHNPQPYWSMQNDDRKVINQDGNSVASASISANSWKFYDKNKSLLWQFIFALDTAGENSTWVAVLGSDGLITFYNLNNNGGSLIPSPTKIPEDSCSTPEPCGPYYVCTNKGKCYCPSAMRSHANCNPGLVSCDGSNGSVELVEGDNGLGYFALGFLSPSSKTDLNGCKSSCLGNCSCLAMFFHSNSGNCFMLDSIGGFKNMDSDSGFVSYIKVSRDEGSESDSSVSGSIDSMDSDRGFVCVFAY